MLINQICWFTGLNKLLIPKIINPHFKAGYTHQTIVYEACYILAASFCMNFGSRHKCLTGSFN